MKDPFNPLNEGKDLAARLRKEEWVPKREARTEVLHAGIVIIGGGIAGVCAALAAARGGATVVLIQDRPILGGNASSEIRLWMLGATSHMGNNNRWAREGGIIGEILVENMFRNPEGNPLILDALLLELVSKEKKITLLLNTALIEVEKRSPEAIESVLAFCSQNSTRYRAHGSAFMDCSGDGIMSFLAGAAFRMGAETEEEFGEKMAPKEDYGNLLGHSLYFYSKDTGRKVSFVKPAFCDVNIDEIYPYRSFDLEDQGCKFWWVEYGGRLDTVHDTEIIKWELWKVVYGIWDYIKNSGKFPDSETHTLEWVGAIPGKRESRRFEGMKTLTQQDIVERRTHSDAVAYGGWAIDLHPADGVYSKRDACFQVHSKGVYQMPLGMAVSRNISNLAYGGRIVSATHVAFGSTRVMATCGNLAQATGLALAYALETGISLPEILEPENIREVQKRLHRMGQYIPRVPMQDETDLTNTAQFSASSELSLSAFPADGPMQTLDVSCAMLIPVRAGEIPAMSVRVKVFANTQLTVELRKSLDAHEYTPDFVIETLRLSLTPSSEFVECKFKTVISEDRYLFITFLRNEQVQLASSETRLTGVLSLYNSSNKAVSNSGKQAPIEDLGVESFEFWCPRRRPDGQNVALFFEAPVYTFSAGAMRSGYSRPTHLPNAWVADREDSDPMIQLEWETRQEIRRVVVNLDTDFDHSMESVLMGHPENVMPFCVNRINLFDDQGLCIGNVSGNHQSQVVFEFGEPVQTKLLKVKVEHPSIHVPAAIFSINCY